MPQGLTVLAPIRSGEEAALRDVLRAIGDDIRGANAGRGAGRPHVAFTSGGTIHFARFAILRDPDRGQDRGRLLFSSNYDGPLDAHLAELVEITSDMDAIWGRCEGYSGKAAFPAFIRAHAHEPEAFYIAFPDETARTIRNAGGFRRVVHERLDTGTRADLGTDAPGVERVIGAARHRIASAWRRLRRAAPIALDIVRAMRRHGATAVVRSTLRIVASLDRYPLFRIANRITRNGMPPRISTHSSVALDNCGAFEPAVPGDEIPSMFPTPPAFREDVVTQNQLTLVTAVDPAGVDRVRAVMSAIDSYAKRLAPPGSLIGISTIHFVRWLLVDEGRRLIMLSDYDGSWENYIDEFAEMILSGLDAIWETSHGFPPDGARDLPAFKRFLRVHQVAAEVFYSAYPDQTVLNVSQNLRLCRAVLDRLEPVERLLPTV